MTDTRVAVGTTPARAAGRWVARHPRSMTSTVVLGASVVWLGYLVVLSAAGVAVVAGASWCLLDRPTFDRFAGRLLRAWWRRWVVYQRQWFDLAYRAGLVITDHRGRSWAPKVLRVSSSWCWDHVRIRMVKTQEPGDFEAVLERLANAYRARRATVRTLKPGVISLDFQRREPFDEMPVPLPPLPESPESVDLGRLVIGRTEYGRDFALDLLRGLHVMLAGATGSGKGSWLWGLIRQLAPMVRAGSVRLWVIDPKGGMEFGAGREMFHRFADSDETGLDLMHEYVETLDARKEDLGRQGVRTATASPTTPMDVLIVDELAAMTQYCTRDIAREFEPLLGKALTQYRAVLGRVVGAVQEPHKDTVPMRGLFPTKIALRLDEASYVDMTLGEGVRDRGALADQIPEIMPGVGYVKHDGRREPQRVRAAFTSDDDIAALVAYCTGSTITPLRREQPPAPRRSAIAEATEADIESIDFFDGDDEDHDAA